ncbi:MAG: GHMP kinase [bacterium]|nr:GHMP kinase [bacterium]
METERLKISAPGRICLFGEHQDYLGLPVIAAAIDLRISVAGKKRDDLVFSLDMPDISQKDEIDLRKPVEYVKERDYFRSGLNVLLRSGAEFKHGYDCLIQGNIPINAGTSSSSALSVAWIKFLLETIDDDRKSSLIDITRSAHEAEVVEFREPGGMMDHYMAAYGGVQFIDFNKKEGVQKLPAEPGKFVLGNSCEPKDTTGILGRVKFGTIDALKVLMKEDETIDINNLTMEQLEEYFKCLSKEQYELLKGNIINRELTLEAKELMQSKRIDNERLGELLNLHQEQLRERLMISTPKIDRMLDSALKTGALGGKINGSGGGGCMFVYAPDNSEEVAESIRKEGGIPYIVTVDEGVEIEDY